MLWCLSSLLQSSGDHGADGHLSSGSPTSAAGIPVQASAVGLVRHRAMASARGPGNTHCGKRDVWSQGLTLSWRVPPVFLWAAGSSPGKSRPPVGSALRLPQKPRETEPGGSVQQCQGHPHGATSSLWGPLLVGRRLGSDQVPGKGQHLVSIICATGHSHPRL